MLMQITDETAARASKNIGPLGAMGKIRQIAIVTNDLYRSIGDMLKAGLGPWKVYGFDAETVTERTYMGQPADFVYKIGLAEMPGMAWELLQPISGKNVCSDFLAMHGEGVHHLLAENEDMTLAEKEAAFAQSGFTCIQSGKWMGLCTFAFYQANPTDGLIFEIVHKDEGWKRPDPEAIFEI
jgi:methylmalonyl-CoA/ethylmalonyl-CoA epimerase